MRRGGGASHGPQGGGRARAAAAADRSPGVRRGRPGPCGQGGAAPCASGASGAAKASAPPGGGEAEVLADQGDHLGHGAVEQVGVVGLGQPLPDALGQALDLVGVVAVGLDGPLDAGVDAVPPLGGLGAARLGGRLRARRQLVGEAGLQGEGEAHGAGGAGIGQRRIGRVGARFAGRGQGGGAAPRGLGDLHADLGQPSQHRHLPFDPRARRRLGVGGRRGEGAGQGVGGEHGAQIAKLFAAVVKCGRRSRSANRSNLTLRSDGS
jgi:hypothetical protein